MTDPETPKAVCQLCGGSGRDKSPYGNEFDLSGPSQLEELQEKYSELLSAVTKKFPEETRHETALRYIRSIESRDNGPASNFGELIRVRSPA